MPIVAHVPLTLLPIKPFSRNLISDYNTPLTPAHSSCVSLLHPFHSSIMSEAVDTNSLMCAEEDVLQLWQSALLTNVGLSNICTTRCD